jgi:hypothetical protein
MLTSGDRSILKDIRRYIMSEQQVPRHLIEWMLDELDRLLAENGAQALEIDDLRAALDDCEHRVGELTTQQ